MSAEALLLLALFILLPLLERGLRSLRERQQEAANVPRPGPPAPPPPLPPQPPLVVPEPRAADLPEIPAGVARQAPRPAPAPPRRRRTGRRTLVEDLRHPATLRRAVVLMTILGPCRSVAPHDWDAPS